MFANECMFGQGRKLAKNSGKKLWLKFPVPTSAEVKIQIKGVDSLKQSSRKYNSVVNGLA